MGVILDLNNVEQLVFNNKKVIASLPQHKQIFDNWLLSKRVPAFRNLEQKSCFDFLQNVTEEELEIISIINNMEIDKVESLARSVKINAKPEQLEMLLNRVSNFDGFCCYRNKDEVQVYLWK